MEFTSCRVALIGFESKVSNIRLIARLDIKGANLIKGIQLEGLRVLGLPNDFALHYYQQGADELIYIDNVASLYGRSHILHLVREATKNIFIPITVGGGIRTAEDAGEILRNGADKVAVSTAAVINPKLITEISQQFGSQCAVASIEAKRISDERWEVLTNNGREKTGIDVVEWSKRCADNGAGEILLTSVDREGTRRGYDIELVSAVSNSVNIPVIASGGMGVVKDILDVVGIGGASAFAMADVLHYKRLQIPDIRSAIKDAGLDVRKHE